MLNSQVGSTAQSACVRRSPHIGWLQSLQTPMNTLHSDLQANHGGAQEDILDLGFLQNYATSADPVEAYFECITQCSLDDGECVTVCTTILREQA